MSYGIKIIKKHGSWKHKENIIHLIKEKQAILIERARLEKTIPIFEERKVILSKKNKI